jgi:integrase
MMAPSEAQWHYRLQTVVRLARFMAAEDPRHEISPADVFRGSRPRPTPYIFSDDEIRQLLVYAGRLGPPPSVRLQTYSTLYGLLAVTGMRVAEALAPHLTDVTVDGLLIRNTKFKKSRLLPLHATRRAALDRYLVQRRRVAGTNEGKVATCKPGDLVLKRPDGAFIPACYLKPEFVHHGRHRAFDGYHGRLLLDNLRADVALEQAGLSP